MSRSRPTLLRVLACALFGCDTRASSVWVVGERTRGFRITGCLRCGNTVWESLPNDASAALVAGVA